MAFTIKLKDINKVDNTYNEILKSIQGSRFKAEVRLNKNTISFHKIRLQKSKEYCGSHAGPCLLGGPDRKAVFLEGADWVEFNDRLNNIMDKLGLSANIASSVCVIRKGFLRRIKYSGGKGGEWLKDENAYLDNCGKPAIKSSYPSGTPGIYST